MKVLLTTIPSDSHTWNLIYLQFFLQESGFKVINLGACVPVELVVENAYSYRPDIIVVSSVNGLAHIEGCELAKGVRSHPLLQDINMVIGGKIGTKGMVNFTYSDKLLQSGYNAVFLESNSMDDFTNYLMKINRKSKLAIINNS